MSSKALAILGSGPEYNHTAAAPIYFAYGDYTATIHLFNASSDTITVELSCYATGRATPTVPAEYELAPQATRTVDLATLLTPDKVEERVMGAVRLRHTGEKPHDILAGVTVDRDDMRKSFFVPFRYATYDPQAPDKVRIAPFVYLGTEMTSYVALQNLADVPDTASIALNYETGFRGGPTATIELPGVTLDAHETFIVDVSSYADQVPNATWGSVEMRSASQTVVAHAVMISRTGDFAVDCAFVDPASATSTTRVLSPVVFDYDRQSIVYAMVRNVSAAQRTVTYSYTTPSGTQTIDVEIDAGHQQLVVLDSLEVLSAGQTKITDIRLTYTGDPGDIVASGATISEKAQIGLPARSVEARATDTSRFISPYFNLDGNTVAFAQLRNLTGAEIKVGAKLHVEDAPGIPLTSKLVTVPANGDATLDLQDLFNAVPDTLSARGALELQHDGQAGALAATFGVVGVSVRMARAVAVQPVAMAAGCGLTAYPNTFTATPGQVVPLAYMREGGPVTPELLVQGGGTVTPPVAAGDKVYTATYTAPSGFSTVAKQVIAADAQTHVPFTCGTSVGTSVLVDLDERRFTTFDPSGIPTNGRLNNDTVTSFTLRKKANSPSFPAGTLRVSFKKGTQAVLSDEIALASSADEISGTAHPHEQFVGDVKVVVERNNNGEWEAISRNKNVGAYYAFSPPDSADRRSPPIRSTGLAVRWTSPEATSSRSTTGNPR